MIRNKPALGLDPRVEAGFPKRSCSTKNCFAAAQRLLLRLVASRSRFALRAVILPLENACRLAASAAQIIELGAAHLAAAHHLDRVDHRRIEREDALDAFAV